MRTQAAVNTIIDNAMLNYSGAFQYAFELKQRGIDVEANDEDFTEITNWIKGIQSPALTLNEQSIMADQIVRMGYAANSTQDLFTELVYCDDYDSL